MTVSLSHPGWLVLLPVVAGAAWWMHRWGLVDLPAGQRRVSLGLRIVLLACILLALSGLRIGRPDSRQFVVFLMDRSASIDTSAADAARAFVESAWAGRRGGDEGRVIRFAEHTSPMMTVDEYLGAETNTLPVSWPDRETNLRSALEVARAQMDPEFGPRIVLLTDGRITGPDPSPGIARIREAGGRLDVWPVPPRTGSEVQVLSVRAPARVHGGQPFETRVRVQSSSGTPAEARVFLNGIEVGRQAVTLHTGENLLVLPPLTAESSLSKVRVQIVADADTLIDNNYGASLVRSEGAPAVLLIESRPQDARFLRRALKHQGVEVDVRSARGMPRTLSELRAFDLLCLSDVPATDLTSAQMDLVRTYVKDFGGGFLMLGGDTSFGLGGYFRTPVEEILPVRTDFERERETPTLAMALVIDKSGSMSGQKIELAKEASRATLELLDPRDQIAVLAFDGQARWVCEMHPASDRQFVMDRISSLQAGGGTDLSPALAAAYSAMERTSAKLKHVILLSDGHSTPGRFFELVSSMRASGITVSTVGVGGGADRALLEQIAGWGNGRYYFTVDPLAVPQIFAKETMAASRSAIQEAPFQAVPVLPHPVIRGIDWDAAPFLLGYVMTRPKPTAEILLATERGDPLLATWRYGLGTVTAFTSDVKARWAAEWIEWDGFAAFWAQVIRDTMRAVDDEGLVVRLAASGGHIRAVAEPAEEGMAQGGRMQLAARLPDGSNLVRELFETAPGRYEAEFDAGRDGEVHARVTYRVGDQDIASAPASFIRGYPEELRVGDPDTAAMQAWAAEGGGEYDPDPATLLETGRRPGYRWMRAWPGLLAAALLLLPLDIAFRRFRIPGA